MALHGSANELAMSGHGSELPKKQCRTKCRQKMVKDQPCRLCVVTLR